MARWGRRRLGPAVGALTVGAVVLAMAAVVPTGTAMADPPPGLTASGAQGLPVPLDRAGEFVGWGRSVEGQLTPPAELAGVALREVATNSNVTLALTADGRVVAWGYDNSALQDVPSRVASMDVVDIELGMAYAGAVSRTGEVAVWGISTPRAEPTDVPAGLEGVTRLVIGQENAFALKEDGSVVAWGRGWIAPAYGDPGYDLTAVPAGLHAIAVSAGSTAAYAVTTQGTVVAWGSPVQGQLDLPPAVQVPGNVVAVSATGYGALALMTDGSLVGWGTDGQYLPELGGKRAVAIAGGRFDDLALDEDGAFHHGGQSPGSPSDKVMPTVAMDGLPISQFSLGAGHGGMIVTKLLRGALPTVVGAPQVGSTLTGTPGTFSASPDSVASQWLADGTPIPGASGPSLTVTSALKGKAISYASTATKAGETPVTATSTATDAVSDPPPPPVVTKATSTTKVVKVTVARKAAKVTVTGKVAAARSQAGTARVVITKGRKTIVSTTVKVAANGGLSLVVKRFGKLAIKKTKSRSKTGYAGRYQVTVSYVGNAQVKPSKAARAFVVKK